VPRGCSTRRASSTSWRQSRRPEYLHQQHRIKTRVGERQLATIRLDKACPSAIGTPIGEDPEHPAGKIDADIVIAGRNKRPANAPGTRSEIEEARPVHSADRRQDCAPDRVSRLVRQGTLTLEAGSHRVIGGRQIRHCSSPPELGGRLTLAARHAPRRADRGTRV
jgi:hypothetical protein